MPGFVGRTDELKRLEQEILDPDTRRITSILGLGGIGKSRLALELAYQIKLKHPQYSIFWIEAAQQLTFEKDVLDIGKKLRIAGIEEDKADVKTLVKQRLSSLSAGKRLLILDNADDEALWGKPPDSTRQELSLVEYLPRTTNGSILITTRTRRIATFLAGNDVINLGAVLADEAVEMLINGLETPDLAADRPTILTLVDKLAYLPLAIVQAASFINMTQRPVQTYVEILDKSEVDVIKLLSKDFGDPSRYTNAKNPVATTWLISFNHIRTRHPLAATFLSSMACFHEKNIPRSLLPEAERVLGAEHPNTLMSINNIASTYRNQGRWKEAEELEVQVMETMKRVLGAEHPSTLISMNNLAHTFKHQDHNDRAIELMTYCMGLCIKVLGPSHHLTQSVLMTLTAWSSARCVTGEQGGQGNSHMPGAWVDYCGLIVSGLASRMNCKIVLVVIDRISYHKHINSISTSLLFAMVSSTNSRWIVKSLRAYVARADRLDFQV